MKRWFFKIYNFVMAIVSIVILFMIFAQEYTRDLPGMKSFRLSDGSIDATRNISWPFKMQLRMINYVCTTPSPNLVLTEEELIAAWSLPPKTRLSDRMSKIARCHLAAKQITSSEFDPSKCDCVDGWPIGAVRLIADPLIALNLCACFYLWHAMFVLSIFIVMDKNQNDGKLLYKIAHVPYVLWYVAMSFLYLTDYVPRDLDIVYTAYGQMYPSSYYEKPADRDTIVYLLLVAYAISVIEIVIRSTICDLLAKKIQKWFVPKVKVVAASIPIMRFAEKEKDEFDEDVVEIKMIV